jgi:hypothetical protein
MAEGKITLAVKHFVMVNNPFKGGKPEMMTVSEDQAKGQMKRPDPKLDGSATSSQPSTQTTTPTTSKAPAAATKVSTDKRTRPKYKIVESGQQDRPNFNLTQDRVEKTPLPGEIIITVGRCKATHITHTHIHTHTHTHTHTHIHMYTYTHTHTHTYIYFL